MGGRRPCMRQMTLHLGSEPRFGQGSRAPESVRGLRPGAGQALPAAAGAGLRRQRERTVAVVHVKVVDHDLHTRAQSLLQPGQTPLRAQARVWWLLGQSQRVQCARNPPCCCMHALSAQPAQEPPAGVTGGSQAAWERSAHPLQAVVLLRVACGDGDCGEEAEAHGGAGHSVVPRRPAAC